ncbi:AlbA family DNA-binding domain-containing protein [Flavilitoribacter nigricans]
MISYFYQEELLSSQEMIRKGESESREFKTSINREVRTPIVRTLCGFMNLHGGTVFVGVTDGGQVAGVDATTKDLDKFERDIRSLIRLRLGTFFNNLVHFELEGIYGKTIVRIDCDAARSPVFFRTYNQQEEQEEFIVRTGNANTHIKKGSEIIKYYQRRYK